jgi:hypothetical protein
MKFLIVLLLFQILYQQINTESTKDQCNNKGLYKTEIKKCLCIDGYITFPNDSIIQCNYQLKSDKIARFLSFFGGMVGADMFYLGYKLKGFFKCLFPTLSFFLIYYFSETEFIKTCKYK